MTAKHFGVDLDGHTSRQVDYDLIESYDVIAAMETRQYNFLRKTFPEFREKIFLLPLFDLNDNPVSRGYGVYNITDPFGKDEKEYRECFQKISSCIVGLLKNINK
jgi:protein-tyrosine-phosphatase